MRSPFAAALLLSACAGGDTVGGGGPSPFGGGGGPGSNASADDDDESDGGDDSTSELPAMTSAPATGEPAPDPTGVDSSGDGAPDQPPNNPGPAGDCCTAGPAGCANDPAVEACVCQLDDFCCTTEWDDTCVWQVGECAPACPGAVPPDQGESSGGFEEGGVGEDGGGFGDCCAPTGVPGCGDPMIAACVCFIDDYCCFVEWDDVCAEIAQGCGC